MVMVDQPWLIDDGGSTTIVDPWSIRRFIVVNPFIHPPAWWIDHGESTDDCDVQWWIR